MPAIELRKVSVNIEEIHHEGGPPPRVPLLRGSIIAVLSNPFSGRYEENISRFMKDLEPLGVRMADQLAQALGGPDKIQSYGKGAIIGANGELEHGALWHVPGGYAMRDVLGDAKAIVPSAKKVGAVGARLDIPITHINASYVRSHFDAMEVGSSDAPRADELLLALVMTTGGRIHARVGGLGADDVEGHDGLR